MPTLDAHLANEVFSVPEFAGRVEGDSALVLLDLEMPKVDRLAMLRQIKRYSDPSMIPAGAHDLPSRGPGLAGRLPSECERLHGQADDVQGLRRRGDASGRLLGCVERAAARQRALARVIRGPSERPGRSRWGQG